MSSGLVRVAFEGDVVSVWSVLCPGCNQVLCFGDNLRQALFVLACFSGVSIYAQIFTK